MQMGRTYPLEGSHQRHYVRVIQGLPFRLQVMAITRTGRLNLRQRQKIINMALTVHLLPGVTQFMQRTFSQGGK
ncbi:hypothetical protein D3C76_1430470 [compost metagenome]